MFRLSTIRFVVEKADVQASKKSLKDHKLENIARPWNQAWDWHLVLTGAGECLHTGNRIEQGSR